MTLPIQAIATAFAKGRPAFMPYFSLGFPDYATSLDIIAACAENGADLMELGLPFSDPLADGPTIQHSTQIALQNGITTAQCLQAVKELRQRGVTIPLMLMGYYNPILAFGLENFVHTAAQNGANGLIVPDLPAEEAGELDRITQAYGLGLTYFLSPTSTPERIHLIAQKARGFVYLVSVTGITGARSSVSADLQAFVGRVRAQVQVPLAVGFGISTPEQARTVGELADGVIMGSQLIKLAEHNPNAVSEIGQFVKQVVQALA
ncbi:MAG TPA: tryptophan synthase subunit alpha [Anaerolineales bacterium]|nr:tryptophan synthase subunit alpha [Anaerolineales bacterium]